MTHGEHPTEAAFERFAADEMSVEDRSAFLDHASACRECAPILRAVLELRRLSRGPAAVVPFGRPRRRAVWLLTAAAGLAAALVLVVVRPLDRGPATADSTLRAPQLASLRALEPHGVLDRAPTIARWEPWSGEGADRSAAGGVEYRFVVVRVEGQVVAERLLPAGSEPQVAWPAEASAAGSYAWSVEALLDGERVARSRLVDVRW